MDDEFCVIHGYEHMRRESIFDKVAYCAACERERRESAETAKALDVLEQTWPSPRPAPGGDGKE